MSDQLSLLPDPRAPYRRESPASRDGALAVEPKLNDQLRRCLREYRCHEDLTDREMAYLTGYEISVVNARRDQLMKRGLVEGPVGRRKSECPEATSMSVGAWRATEHGE